MTTKNTARARRSFKTSAPKISVTIGETDFNAHMLAADEHAIETARAERASALEETFASLPEIDESVIDQVSAQIEAEALSSEIHESEPSDPVVAEPTLAEIMATLDEFDVEMAQRTINAAIDDRVAFESQKKGDGANIQRTLKKAREGLGLSKGPARVLIAAHVDAAFVNRTLHDGSRYNVYAIDKVVDVLRALSHDTGEVRNAINRACLISLFRLKRVGIAFTSEIAKGCASDKHHVDLSLRKHLARHTVSAVTAPTQASSTMQALETLGVVRREGSARSATYHLTDSPITRALEVKLGQAA